jgi:hypothetical protein
MTLKKIRVSQETPNGPFTIFHNFGEEVEFIIANPSGVYFQVLPSGVDTLVDEETISERRLHVPHENDRPEPS